MLRKHQIRIVEIHVHRSKKNKKLAHAVALLFPCNHNKYLGLTLYKGPEDTNFYRTEDVRIIRIDDYSIMDKEVCKLCPHDDFWLDSLESGNDLEDFVQVLESIEDF